MADALDQDLPGYNASAKGTPWLVLRDLDDEPCAPALLRRLAVRPAKWMCLRIPVREVEAWLLADGGAIARYLKVPVSKVPRDPDSLPDPTRTIVNLARQSTKPAIVREMTPKQGAAAVVGPLYETRLIEFATNHWDLDRASKRSRSLLRARDRLRTMAEGWKRHVKGL
jgi:hypothetical protein